MPENEKGEKVIVERRTTEPTDNSDNSDITGIPRKPKSPKAPQSLVDSDFGYVSLQILDQ